MSTASTIFMVLLHPRCHVSCMQAIRRCPACPVVAEAMPRIRRCSKASACLSPAWLQRVRDSRIVAFLKSAAGPVISYAAALLLALGCTATIFLVIAAKTQSIPLYSREGGLQLVSAGELQLNGTNGSWHAKTLHL